MTKSNFPRGALLLAGWFLLLFLCRVQAQAPPPNAVVAEAPARFTVESLNHSWHEAMLHRLRAAPLPLTEPSVQSGRKVEPRQPAQASAPKLPVLTLEDVLRIVTQHHPKLRGAAMQRLIATEKSQEKQGAFDPVFTTGTDWLRYNAELDGQTLRGKTATARLAGAEVEFLTRYGLKVAAGTRFNLGKVKAPFAPTGSGGEYFVELKIPFLRGARLNEKTAAEKQALLGAPLAEAEYEQTRLALILKAAESYWEWVAAKRKLDVARDLLTLAEFRAQAVRDRVAAGDLPAIDATEADLETQRRQGGLTKAERDLQKSAFKLSLYLWAPDGQQVLSPEPSQVPVSRANPLPFSEQQLREGQQLAQERRPELKALSLDRQINQVALDLAKNQRLPAVDFTFSPGRDMGAGAIGNTLKAGLNFTLPLRQRTVDGRIGQAAYKIQKIEFDTLHEKQRILTEVQDAISAINTTYERYRAAAQEAAFAGRLEEGERTKFQLGDSTLFLVNQRERATAEARVKLIELHAEYEQALATFRTVTVQY